MQFIYKKNFVFSIAGNSNSVSGNNAMGGGSGMMHMGRMIHSESEMNSNGPRSTASSSAATSGREIEREICIIIVYTV